MRYGLLKSLLAKHIVQNTRLAYCHVDRVLAIEGKQAILTALVKTLNDRIMHWFIETTWETDAYGTHKILTYKILKEDELDGYPQGNESLQADSKGLFA